MSENLPPPGGEQLLDRRGFLRQMWVTLLAALGFAGLSAAFARQAQAAGTFCNFICCNCCGGGGKNRYRCTNQCTGNTYTLCSGSFPCRDFQRTC